MMPNVAMQRWIEHSSFTDPGRWAAELAAIGPAPEAAVRAIQGLLVHGGALEFYGVRSAGDFNRETLPVEARLAAILADGAGPLTHARSAARRSTGTCRDYSVLLCAAIRAHGQPARVRCGFASYLGDAPWEDHWVCERWEDHRWRRADAQLDPVLQRMLRTAFDPMDVPSSMFITADQAWRRCRIGEADPMTFGHGDARGLWFVYVNLIRDRLALADHLTSAWDTWRTATSSKTVQDPEVLAQADSLATENDPAAPIAIDPWWLN